MAVHSYNHQDLSSIDDVNKSLLSQIEEFFVLQQAARKKIQSDWHRRPKECDQIPKGRDQGLQKKTCLKVSLSKITHAKNNPSDWASPEQRCRAAIKAMGQYAQVIPLNRSHNNPQI